MPQESKDCFAPAGGRVDVTPAGKSAAALRNLRAEHFTIWSATTSKKETAFIE